MKCIVHVRAAPRTAKLIKLGHKSWSKIKESGKLWCNVDVDCPESELARQRLEDWECEEFPTDGGYHQLCYNAFCNTTNIQRKIAHHGSRSADDASAREVPIPVSQPTRDRPKRTGVISHVLPKDRCLICHKPQRFFKSHGKSQRSRMMMAETEDGGKYLEESCQTFIDVQVFKDYG